MLGDCTDQRATQKTGTAARTCRASRHPLPFLRVPRIDETTPLWRAARRRIELLLYLFSLFTFHFLLSDLNSGEGNSGASVLGMSVSGMELQFPASVDQMMSTVIENNLFNLSFTSTQAACEISQEHFGSATTQEEPLAEDVKITQWERKLVRMVSGLFLRSTSTSGKFRALDFSYIYCLSALFCDDREKVK